MSRRVTAIALGLASAVAVGVLWGTDWPLGVPGQWTWERIPYGESNRFGSLLGAFQALLSVVAVVLAGWAGERLMPRPRHGQLPRAGVPAVCLIGLIFTGFLSQQLLQQSLPPGYGIERSPWVLYYPGSSGYYFEARRVTSMENFRERYLGVLTDPSPHRRTLHLGTHPPGLFLFHLGVRESCRRIPVLRDTLLSWQPTSVRRAGTTILEGGRPIPPVDTAALWLAALMTQLAAVATAIPLYGLVRIDHPHRTAWRASVLWMLVPAVTIFLPKSDCLYPFVAVTATWLWWSSLRGGQRWRAVLAGLVVTLGLSLSLAFLPAFALAAILSLNIAVRDSWSGRKYLGWCVASATGAAIPILACWVLTEINLVSAWWHNFQNHAAFYDQPENPRSYLPWLGVNLIEATLAVGIPLSGLTAAGLMARLRHKALTMSAPGWACLVTWGMLWLSGKNMGEAARLWLLLLPWACWVSAMALDRLRQQDWLLLLACQAVLAAATVARISGFHFAGL